MKKYADAVHGMICAMRMHRSACEKRIGELGIHHSQHRLLMHLAKRDGVPSQKELAEHFNVSPAAITGSLKTLETGGYIRRTPAKQDMRINGIEITQKGREVIESSRDIFSEIDAKMFEGIDDAELLVFKRCLDRIKSNMEADR